jgi:hypothetical protein
MHLIVQGACRALKLFVNSPCVRSSSMQGANDLLAPARSLLAQALRFIHPTPCTVCTWVIHGRMAPTCERSLGPRRHFSIFSLRRISRVRLFGLKAAPSAAASQSPITRETTMHTFQKLSALFVIPALLLGGCSSSDNENPNSSGTPEASSTSEGAEQSAPSEPPPATSAEPQSPSNPSSPGTPSSPPDKPAAPSFNCQGTATCNVTTTDGVTKPAKLIFDAPGGNCGFADPVTRTSLRLANGTLFSDGNIVGNYTRDNSGFPTGFGYELDGKTIQLSQCRR